MGNYSLKNVKWEKMDNHVTYFENIVTDYPLPVINKMTKLLPVFGEKICQLMKNERKHIKYPSRQYL